MNALAPVREFSRPYDMAPAQERQASRVTARVNLQSMRMHYGVFSLPVMQDNGKGIAS